MNELLPGVFTWAWFSERHGYDFNGYLLRAPGGNVCIDPVEMSDAVLDAIAAEGVAHIVLTNRNHTRASARVQARTGATIAIHAADAAHARAQGVTIDRELAFGDTVGPFVALDASGKSPGEVALHWPARRMLVVGDACVGNPPGACALLPEKVIDDPVALRASLARLATVDFDALLLGDGHALTTGGRAALAALVASFARPEPTAAVPEAAVAQYLTSAFAGVQVDAAEGVTAFSYNPERTPSAAVYFATLKRRDDAFDDVSNLDRPTVFRLNVGVSVDAYTARFGPPPPPPGPDDVVETTHDFTVLDQVMPHPAYAYMAWVCVLSPSAATFEGVKPLLADAYALAVMRYAARPTAG